MEVQNQRKTIEDCAIHYRVLSIDQTVMSDILETLLTAKYPGCRFVKIVLSGPDDLNENDEPSLALEFEADDDAETPEESYDGTDLAELISEAYGSKVSFCTARGNYIDMWLHEEQSETAAAKTDTKFAVMVRKVDRGKHRSYWQVVHVETGDVINDGFVTRTKAKQWAEGQGYAVIYKLRQ